MSAPIEVILTSDASGQLWNTCVWDAYSGTSLAVYKGDSMNANSMCLINGEYLIGAINNKPLLYLWPLQKKEQVQQKIVCPGKVLCMCVSSDGVFCAAGIGEKIYIWQVCNGDLLAVVSRHYQALSCLRFTDDGGYLISAGADSLVIVWSVSSLVSSVVTGMSSIREPVHVLTYHSLPVTDVYVGAGGMRARVVSSSLDHTCKICDLSSGALLCTLVFLMPITSVVMDMTESHLLAGMSNGQLCHCYLHEQPTRTERHCNPDQANSHVTSLRGHSKAVTCLSVSIDGNLLVSGSQDGTARVWDLDSHQCVRILQHKGPVSNVHIMPAPNLLFHHDARPSTSIHPFKHVLYGAVPQGGDNPAKSAAALDDVLYLRIEGNNKVERASSSIQADPLDLLTTLRHDSEMIHEDFDNTDTLKKKIKLLEAANKGLYDIAVQNLVQRTVSDT